MKSCLTLRETASAIGRSTDWFRRHWRDMMRQSHFPPPLPPSDAGADPVWSRHHVEAWMDKDLPPDIARRVAVIRHIEAAAEENPDASMAVARARGRLDAMWKS